MFGQPVWSDSIRDTVTGRCFESRHTLLRIQKVINAHALEGHRKYASKLIQPIPNRISLERDVFSLEYVWGRKSLVQRKVLGRMEVEV